MMCFRDSPREFGPSPMAPCTLVAMTTSSRVVIAFSARPVISSLDPSEYTFAVSKNVIPSSTARRMSGIESSSVSVHAWLPRVGSP
ncbi:hypothetical protein ACAD28_00810 [Clavibacter nebraskensis]